MNDTRLLPQLYTVTGPISPDTVGTIDGHSHTWIDSIGAMEMSAPVLNSEPTLIAGLRAFKAAGGGGVIDCQPGGCGRNGNKLLHLSETSGVVIVAATGFHLRRYYPPDPVLFTESVIAASQLFVEELTSNLKETPMRENPVRAGFIKIACEAILTQTPLNLVEAAVQASLRTDAAIEVHTERGADVEQIIQFMLDAGLPARKLILCHVDKRPDFALHCHLAQAGIGLEYDTFFRFKYDPDKHVWPLLERMISAGLEDSIIIATDRADVQMWRITDDGTGPDGLLTTIIPRMMDIGFSPLTIRKLTALNVSNRLARIPKEVSA